FHMANGPLGSMVSLYMKHVGGSDTQVAWIVLVAQPIMIPTAWLAGKACTEFGRKPVFALAFFLLPLRIFLYSLVGTPEGVLAVTALDGVISGIFGVLTVLMSSDLTGKHGGFNSLMGLLCTMPALGSMLGSVLQGEMVQHFGFKPSFLVFVLIALAAAVF